MLDRVGRLAFPHRALVMDVWVEFSREKRALDGVVADGGSPLRLAVEDVDAAGGCFGASLVPYQVLSVIRAPY